MKISLITSHGKRRQIGLKGSIPFKSDLSRFKYLTLGKTLLMGRKTYDSVGKPLEGCQIIVVSRQRDYAPENVFVVSNMEEAVQLAMLIKTTELMVCGGESLYDFFMPIADSLYITKTNYNGIADAVFPVIVGEWDLYYSEKDQDGTFEVLNKK